MEESGSGLSPWQWRRGVKHRLCSLWLSRHHVSVSWDGPGTGTTTLWPRRGGVGAIEDGGRESGRGWGRGGGRRQLPEPGFEPSSSPSKDQGLNHSATPRHRHVHSDCWFFSDFFSCFFPSLYRVLSGIWLLEGSLNPDLLLLLLLLLWTPIFMQAILSKVMLGRVYSCGMHR